MAQLTKADFVDELQARGWSRFDGDSLNRYLDWALQDVYRLGKFDAVADLQEDAALAIGDSSIPFDDIAAAAASVHAINAMYIVDAGGQIITLTEAIRERFWKDIYPNSLASATMQTRNQPQEYYVYGESVYIFPAADYAYHWHIHYTGRADEFADDDDTSGLPERMDTAILAAAEMQCCKRARDVNGYALAEAILTGLISGEIGNENRQYTEEAPRIGRYTH